MLKVAILKDVNKLKLIIQPRYASNIITEFPDTSNIKRGTGGRSSFNGIVATVFGATRNLGRTVVTKLGKIGTQCIIPYRCSELRIQHLKLMGDLGQIIFHPFHLKDEESLYKVMKYSNVVINMVNRANETSNFSYDEVHVDGARRLARIARECGVKKFIHVSCLNARPNPEPIIFRGGSKYYRSKFYGEEAVKEEFPSATILRPSWMYGSEDRFIRYYTYYYRHINRKYPMWKWGRGFYKNPVYVPDVAEAIVNAVLEPSAVGKTYELFGPRRYELAEILDYMFRCMEKDYWLWGYQRRDLRFSPAYWLKILFQELVCIKEPWVNCEILEQEHTSDIITKGLPRLADLGVNPSFMEDKMPWELRIYPHAQYFDREYGDVEFKAAPPKFVRF